jgi:hypothetical protein
MPSGTSPCECRMTAKQLQHSSCLFLQAAPRPQQDGHAQHRFCHASPDACFTIQECACAACYSSVIMVCFLQFVRA